ncbi:MAG TPA: PAS domain S-box protein [Syntrophales bacterium]|nr:PAS domain S-box protein [Syntrophales bacterium]
MTAKPSYEDLERRIGVLEEELIETRHREVSLQDTEDRYRLLVENANDAILLIQDGVVKFVNYQAVASFGYSEQEFLTTPIFDLVHPEDRSMVTERYLQKIRGDNQPTRFTYRTIHKNGQIRWIENSSVMVKWQGRPATLNLIMDITERQRAEEELRESENRLRAQYHGIPIPTFTWRKRGEDFILVSLNDRAKAMVGNRTGAFLGRSANEIYKNRPAALTSFRRCFDERRVIQLETRSENFMPGRIAMVTFVYVPPDSVMVHADDITERKQAEEALRNSEARYQFLAESMADVVFTVDMNLVTTYVSPSIKRMLGFSPSERVAQNVGQQLTPESQRLILAILTEELEREKEAGIDPDRSRTLELEYYHKDGSIRHLVTYIRAMRDAEGRLTGFYGSHHDITDRKRAEEELQRTLESLRKSFGATIQVMVSAVESRDPYTAGHQNRAADLARAIAEEMGLPRETIDGILMAASIHDIGKLSVPAEILSRPTKLSAPEFYLIKEHAQKGYDILKNVESPWPLAEIVYQHHERLDGSGYPRNLKGDEILLESRIMAVADVVESMASHRPYRPARGIGKALEEIEKHQGVLYDRRVVEACLTLFRERGYLLKKT